MTLRFYKGVDPFKKMDLVLVLEIDEDKYKALFSNLITQQNFPLIYEEFFVQLFEDSDAINFSLLELEYFSVKFQLILEKTERYIHLHETVFKILEAIYDAIKNRQDLYIVR